MKTYSKIFQAIFKNILLYGLPIYYFLVAVSFYLGTYDSAQIKITIVHVLGLFLVMSWLLLKTEEGNFNFFKKNFLFILPIILLILSGFFSTVISPFKLASLTEFVKRFIYCFFVFIIIDQFDTAKKILKIKNWLVAVSFIICFYGVLQYVDWFFLPASTHPKGLDPFGWRQAFGDRIMSTFGNPNFLGDFLIVMAPISAALFVHKKKWYLALLWILLTACIYFTGSKGAWLGFAAGHVIFILTWIFIFFRDKLSKKILVSAVIISIVISCLTAGMVYKKGQERSGDSISFRIYTWLSAWDMINTNPVLGTGIGTFYLTYSAYRRPQIFFIEGKHSTESDHPENEYIEVWYDEGIVGFAIFLTLLLLVFTIGYKNMRYLSMVKKTKDEALLFIQLGVISAFAAQLVHNTCCVSLRFVSSGVMFWLLIGVTLSIGTIIFRKNHDEYDNVPTGHLSKRYFKILYKTVAVLFFGYWIYYFGGYFIGDYLHSRAITLSRQGNWGEALAIYEKVNKYNPSYPMSYYFKSNVHVDRWKAGDQVLAEKTFKKLWILAPNYVQSRYLAGVMYTKMWNYYTTLKQTELAKGRSGQYIKDIEQKVMDSYLNAIKHYKMYLEIDPVYPLTYYGLAQLYLSGRNLVEAEKTLKAHLNFPKKLKEKPHNIIIKNWEERRYADYGETHAQLGNLYMSQNMFEPAVAEYKSALEFYEKAAIPEQPEQYKSNVTTIKKNLALGYERSGNKENAKNQWEELYKNYDDADAKKYLENFGSFEISKR